MKSDTVNYVIVGTFVLAMLAGGIITVAKLAGRTGATDSYFTTLHDVSEIKFGTKVSYMGYPVGQVKEVTPPEDGKGALVFTLELSIDEQWANRIPDDSVAKVTSSGLLSAVTLDIRHGDSDTKLEPGASLVGEPGTDIRTALKEAANTINNLAQTEAKPLLKNLRRYIDKVGYTLETDGVALVEDLALVAADLREDGPEIIDNVRDVSRDLKTTTEQLNYILRRENAERVDQMLINAKDATAKAAGILADERIDRTLTNVDVTFKNFADLGRDLQGTRQRLDDVLSEENVEKVRSALDNVALAAQNVALAAQNVAQLSRDLRETRKKLDHFVDTLDKIATENRPDIRQTIKEARQVVATVNHHIGTIAYNLEATSRNMREFSRQIRQNPGALLGDRPPADAASLQ